jgi:hypothetical protein
MKKLTNVIAPAIVLALCSTPSFAQDYKHPFGLVDKKKYEKKHTKNVSTPSNSMQYAGANGSLVSPLTGKITGRVSKNSTFIYYFKDEKNSAFTARQTVNHKCLSRSKYFPVLHENYKHPGSCNYKCKLQ